MEKASMENHFGFWALKSPQTRMNTEKTGWTSKVSTPDVYGDRFDWQSRRERQRPCKSKRVRTRSASRLSLVEEGGFASRALKNSPPDCFSPPAGGTCCSHLTLLSHKRKPSVGRRQRVFVWWRRVDSNHRSKKQQIYSLSPLATRELLHIQL